MRQAVLLLACTLAIAQSPRASVSGNVWDAQGAAIADAEIVASTIAASGKIAARTDQTGFYSLRNLPEGEYTIAISHPGFRPYQHGKIVLSAGQSLQLDIQLEAEGASAHSLTRQRSFFP